MTTEVIYREGGKAILMGTPTSRVRHSHTCGDVVAVDKGKTATVFTTGGPIQLSEAVTLDGDVVGDPAIKEIVFRPE